MQSKGPISFSIQISVCYVHSSKLKKKLQQKMEPDFERWIQWKRYSLQQKWNALTKKQRAEQMNLVREWEVAKQDLMEIQAKLKELEERVQSLLDASCSSSMSMESGQVEDNQTLDDDDYDEWS